MLRLFIIICVLITAYEMGCGEGSETPSTNPQDSGKDTAIEDAEMIDVAIAPLDATSIEPDVKVDSGNPNHDDPCEGTTVVTSHQDLEGLAECTNYVGNIIIEKTDINNLDGLRNIILITGALQIRENPFLRNLEGLNSLTSVGGDLDIQKNNQLVSTRGLDMLANINGSFTISENPVLKEITSLDRLATVFISLIINKNPRLDNIEGLKGLQSVGALYIYDNSSLRNLQSLSNIASVSDVMYVANNINLPTCEAEWLQGNIVTIGGEVDISGNNDNGSCDGLL